MRICISAMLCLGCLTVPMSYCLATDILNEDQKLLPSDGEEMDIFAGCISIDGNWAIVGAHSDDNENGIDAGAVYIFRFNGSSWEEEVKLLPSKEFDGNHFGGSASISGTKALIGCPHDDPNGSSSGSAYVFRYNGSTWVEEAKLIASDGDLADQFGNQVFIDGDTALIGAYTDEPNGNGSGSAYVFRFNGGTWVEEAKLDPSDGEPGDVFGWRVALEGDTAVISAVIDDNENGERAGAVYVFNYIDSMWIEVDKLLSSNGSEQDNFGTSLSLSGDTLAIGMYNDSNPNHGSVYIFRFNGKTWVEEVELVASDLPEENAFGAMVRLDGYRVLTANIYDDVNGLDTGVGYVFRYNGESWEEEFRLYGSDVTSNQYFGSNLSIGGDTAFIGAYGDDSNGINSGAAYVFNLPPVDELIGACCTNDQCVVVSEAICMTVYGVYAGDNTTCFNTDCPTECLGDINGDGQVNVSDLLTVIANWGPCP